MTPSIVGQVGKCGIVAVLMIDRVEDAAPLARALLAGGVNVMELTLRTPAALDALRAIRKEVPEMLAGVGTILSPDQVRQALDAGAAFGVSPGVSPKVLAAARAAGLPFAPGIVTPTDIELALEHECRILKFFPAEPSGGLAYLKAIAAPYLHLGVRYLPLGGINDKNMASYIAEPIVAAIGGSWLAPRDLIKVGDWAQITKVSAEAIKIIATVRNRDLNKVS